jgi:RHS repeat-associated protein
VYDGWNLIAILNPQSSILQSFAWGSDLSGSLQGAGGVGGLLFSQSYSNFQLLASSFYAYDGNGNVSALVNATTGAAVAQYEYGPFGEVIRATGPMAKVNAMRFSTKYQDDETALYYYGYRYYDPSPGRWLSRDSIDVKGGLNLYALAFNSQVNLIDKDGQIIPLLLAAGAIFFASEMYVNAPGPTDQTYSGFTGDNVLAYVDIAVLIPLKLLTVLEKSVCCKLVPGGGLAGHSGPQLGHTLVRHVMDGAAERQIQAALANRLANTPRLMAASAFGSRVIAERTISDALTSNVTRIGAWLAGTDRELVIHFTASRPAGYVLARGAAQLMVSPTIRVVLRRVPGTCGRFFVLTAFPEL